VRVQYVTFVIFITRENKMMMMMMIMMMMMMMMTMTMTRVFNVVQFLVAKDVRYPL